MKIGLRPLLFRLLNILSQKLIRTTHQNSHQFKKKLNGNHVICSSSPETNPNSVLSNLYKHNLDLDVNC